MGTRFRGSISIVWLVVILAHWSTSANAENRIFILEKSQPGLLCGYTRESEWAGVPKDKEVEFLAVVRSTDGTVSSILVERFTEDTNTYDEYTIDKGTNVSKLKRTLDVLPDRVTREQIWQIRDGRVAKVSDSWTQFKTGHPVAPDQYLETLGQNPIMLRVADFPFYTLIADKHLERWPGGNHCMPGSMNKLEAPEK
jgi:hypothetical protein